MANNLQKGSAGPMRLYVGSLHFNITEDMLRGIFEPFGRVSILIIWDEVVYYACILPFLIGTQTTICDSPHEILFFKKSTE